MNLLTCSTSWKKIMATLSPNFLGLKGQRGEINLNSSSFMVVFFGSSDYNNANLSANAKAANHSDCVRIHQI